MSEFIFRCDASAEIGRGHVVRCMALANMIRESGGSVTFVMSPLRENAIEIVKEAGWEVENSPRPARFADKILNESDCLATCATARRKGAQIILIDHYGALPSYFENIKKSGLKVAVIDDIADRDFMSVDWLLNQNLNAESLRYSAPAGCVKLFGPHYALLRPQFSQIKKRLRRRFSEQDNRLLITLGGGENIRLYLEILTALNRVMRPLKIKLVAGSTELIPPALTETAAESPHDVEILQNVSNMAQLMSWADLSINAGGSTCWEMCCLGLPMLVLTLSKDQEFIAAQLEKENCAYKLGWWQDDAIMHKIAWLVDELIAIPDLRAEMSARTQSLVNDQGAAKAAESLMRLAE